VLSRGLVGNLGERIVVASPIYKHHFDLTTGQCLEEPANSVPAWPARIDEAKSGSVAEMTTAKPSLVVVVGNGMAGMRTVEELLKLAPDLYDITVFGAEPHGNYNRIMLSPVLAGDKSIDDIMLNPRAWYDEHGITLHAGDPVVQIDRRQRTVHAQSGLEVRYDRLLLATGSKPFIIPVPGHQLPGVIAFRDIQDVETMLQAARNHRHAVVIGGGLLGLEAANGLMRQGMDVTVVHVTDALMNQQLDKPAAALLKKALEARACASCSMRRPPKSSARIASPACASRTAADSGRPGGDDRRRAPQHRTGQGGRPALRTRHRRRRHAADLRPAHLRRGRMRAAPQGHLRPGGADLGPGPRVRRPPGRRRPSPLRAAGHGTKLKVTGVDLYSAGDFIGGEGSEDLVLRDRAAASTSAGAAGAPGRRRAVWRRQGRPVVLRPDPERPRHQRLPRELLFGQAMCQHAA
jgi:nitrite reductase (NADH) large subunit